MRDISFFSEDTYLYLPNTKHPKVILAVSDAKTSQNAYKLYNPFSFKAKVLKKISQFLFVNFNKLTLSLVKTKSHQKSDFIKHLENKLNTKFSISVYHATDKDKVVLQLQSNKRVYGYLKFPLNKVGIDNINNEKKAITLLSKKNIIKSFILEDTYNSIPYFILSELKGDIENLADKAIETLIFKLKKENTFQLIDHQRIKDLYADIETLQLKSYKSKIDRIVKRSTIHYHEAFEHGDFTPWNIVKTNEGIIPFDFEFFVENGIEYFDLIKYHFQVGRLLKKKNPKELALYIFNKINNIEVKDIVSLFLIKEIIRLKKIGQTYQFHDNMLNHICE
ncbi:hypothetical protein [Flavivirga jejuensis]|uniref:Aminoglycoside phosphotransferase domain-containing protein n=1 Tax=Flavivirga jejuensis TaxID=870487 RepID=A0ABT8WT96_9FLAO|nr:hypothetical protein [Flavivirga jejuensis]MDO5976383.1 hypothetical protein [Flavivirga jejuensis]